MALDVTRKVCYRLSDIMPVANEKLRSRLEMLLSVAGMPEAVKKLGVSSEALARLAAGLNVRAGTIALVERGLK